MNPKAYYSLSTRTSINELKLNPQIPQHTCGNRFRSGLSGDHRTAHASRIGPDEYRMNPVRFDPTLRFRNEPDWAGSNADGFLANAAQQAASPSFPAGSVRLGGADEASLVVVGGGAGEVGGAGAVEPLGCGHAPLDADFTRRIAFARLCRRRSYLNAPVEINKPTSRRRRVVEGVTSLVSREALELKQVRAGIAAHVVVGGSRAPRKREPPMLVRPENLK